MEETTPARGATLDEAPTPRGVGVFVKYTIGGNCIIGMFILCQKEHFGAFLEHLEQK